MARYNISFKASVSKDFRSIPKHDVKHILECIEQLAENPRAQGSIKLTGNDCYRVRQGLYRIIYEIQDENLVVMIIKVGHRSAVYGAI
jgi:mRNA interferase RelE/StbE